MVRFHYLVPIPIQVYGERTNLIYGQLGRGASASAIF